MYQSILSLTVPPGDPWGFAHSIVLQLSKCLKFEAVWGALTDQMI